MSRLHIPLTSLRCRSGPQRCQVRQQRLGQWRHPQKRRFVGDEGKRDPQRGSAHAAGRDFVLTFPRLPCNVPGMSIRKRVAACPVYRDVPAGFSIGEIEVRQATPEERPLWDALMDAHHYLGFRRLAGRGLRYVATFRGHWLGLAACRTAPSSAGRATARPTE